MSRLSDLLNPEPSTSRAPNPTEINTSRAGQGSHGRYPSLTSPLEALAIAATNGSSSPTFATSAGNSSKTSQPRNPLNSTTTPLGAAHDPYFERETETLAGSYESHATTKDSSGNGQSSASMQGPNAAGLSDSASSQHRAGDVPPASDAETLVQTTQVKEEPKEGMQNPLNNDIRPQSPRESHMEDAIGRAAISKSDLKREDVTHASSVVGSLVGQRSSPILPSTEAKKRPAPRADKKKGTANLIKKPAAKKRKVEAESKDGTPFSQRSATPTSSRASKTPVPKGRKRGSATPVQSSPAPGTAEDEDDDEDEDSELFCICRKPDDHTWMIGCDGGCEDWFHGRCVNMNERDGKIIDKYICPNCEAKGVGVTTWKPMCRLETCREPARATGPKPSKYCSDEHGELYMRQRVLNKAKESRPPPPKKRRKDNFADHTGNRDGDENEAEGDGQPHLRGGLLRPEELKALVSEVNSVEEFRKLGNNVSKQPSASNAVLARNAEAKVAEDVAHSGDETAQLEQISSEKEEVNHKMSALNDRERFAELVRARAKTVLEEMKRKDKSLKDICGYDSRLSSSDVEFDHWRNSTEGKETLATGVLAAPAENKNTTNDADGDTRMTNGDDGSLSEVGRGACQKKRCERHKQWFKLQLQEVAFEREECRQRLRSLEKEERGVKERAMLRSLDGS